MTDRPRFPSPNELRTPTISQKDVEKKSAAITVDYLKRAFNEANRSSGYAIVRDDETGCLRIQYFTIKRILEGIDKVSFSSITDESVKKALDLLSGNPQQVLSGTFYKFVRSDENGWILDSESNRNLRKDEEDKQIALISGKLKTQPIENGVATVRISSSEYDGRPFIRKALETAIKSAGWSRYEIKSSDEGQRSMFTLTFYR